MTIVTTKAPESFVQSTQCHPAQATQRTSKQLRAELGPSGPKHGESLPTSENGSASWTTTRPSTHCARSSNTTLAESDCPRSPRSAVPSSTFQHYLCICGHIRPQNHKHLRVLIQSAIGSRKRTVPCPGRPELSRNRQITTFPIGQSSQSLQRCIKTHQTLHHLNTTTTAPPTVRNT